MSTVSCILPNAAGEDADVRLLVPIRDNMRGATKFMWVFGSLLMAMSVQMNDQHTGLVITIPVVNILMSLVSSLLLMKGLRRCCWILLVPWIVLSAYQLYDMQFPYAVKLFNALMRRNMNRFFWSMFICYLATMVLRLQLISKMIVLCINQWYCKKLLRELLYVYRR